MPNKTPKKIKIAVFHSFLKNRGGAEKVVIDLSKHYNADFFVGAVRSDLFNKESKDSFSQAVFHELPSFTPLHEDARLPVWRHIKRQLFFMFSPKVNKLREYDIVFISGNVFWVPGRIKRNNPGTKVITYCHTPPRPFTDQKEAVIAKLNPLLRPLFRLFAQVVMAVYKRGLVQSDVLIANSFNIQDRIKKYLDLDSTPIYPPVDTDKFCYIKDGDFYLSHSRLEDMKRIKLIVEAFKMRKDLKLVISSTGPLKDWVENELKEFNLTNIQYRGLVSDEELHTLVGSCKAGIVIPIEEDAGITQCELMSAGKPVLGVAEGGLLETVIHEKTGYLIPKDPMIEDLINGLNWMESHDTSQMKTMCITRSKEFDRQIFFDKMDQTVSNLTITRNV